ncbi:calcium-binding protein [Vibrio natriegens]|uniref:Calx-beta domain-containing protein n=1 Tax=Vibrio natriegens TaxID=691 RepID=UPI0021E82C53|nr:Calx-beta domain-containing protein [Vibrio natriegens]UYI45811.1 calcium-binding protein [Vibrio natriegens]
MDRVTLSSLVGNIVVIGLDGNIRTLAEGESPKPGELIIEEVSDTSELVVEQVTPQGSSINVTDDITALIEAIGQGQDPTQLGEDFETAAGGVNGSSPQNTGAINRTGTEVLASTNFETVGINGTGFSSTQVQTLLDIFQPQAPAPQVTPLPAEVVVQEISSPTVNEGDQVVFDVTLDQATEAITDIEMTLGDGSAVGGSAGEEGTDYVNTAVIVTLSDGTTQEIQVNEDGTFTVSLPIGEQSFTVSLDTVDDDIYEGPETFTLTGTTADQTTPVSGTATVLDDGTGPGTDPDDDRPSVSISDAGIVDEGDTATFTVSLSNASEDVVQVQLTLNPGETEAGDLGTLEYNTGSGWVSVPVDGMVTVPAGMTEFDVRVASVQDEVYEGAEDFSVTVTGVGAVQGSDTGLATIVDDGSGPEPDPDDDRPSVSISDAGIVDEGDIASFTVSLSNASEAAVQVQLTLNPDETEAGDLGTLEYNTGAGWVAVPVDGMVTVPSGMTEFDVRIGTTADDVYEGPEDFSVTVTGIGAVQGSDTGLATIVDDGTITDDDRPSVSISDAGIVDEGDIASFTVSLSNASEDVVQVQLTLNPGETEAGDLGTLEYNTGSGWLSVPVDGMVTVPAGMTEFDVRVATIDDEVYEGPEDFSVTVTGVGVVQGSDTGLATIVDDGTITDDDRPSVSISDAGLVDEGTTATFTVTLSNTSEDAVQVQLALNPDETEAGDLGTLEYNTGSGWLSVPVDGMVTVPAGMTEFDVRVATIDDEVYEGPEDFSVTVTGVGVVQGSDTGLATIVDDGTITDDDRPSVSISDAGLVDEGTTATFTVTLSNTSEDAVQVQLALNPDETEAGDLGTLEYNTGSGWLSVPVDGMVTVPAGMTEFDVRVATIDDEVYEGPEDFSVTVTGVGAVQGSDTGLATIVDDGTITDDDRPSVSISDAGLVDEGTTATFTVTLSNASEDTVQVQLALNPDETEAGDLGALEYNTGSGWVSVPVDGMVTVPAGMTEFDVRIGTTSDDVYEGPEDFSVTVTGVGVVQGSDTGLATIVDDGTITDDDRPSVSISDAGLVDEGTTATFTVTLSNASEDTVQVQLALNPDETEAGDLGALEYNTGSGWVSVPVDGMVTVPAGMTEFDVRIGTTADDVYEGPEDFSVTVTGVGVVQGSDTGLATIVDDGTITDDDRPSVSISDAGLVDEGTTATFTVTLSNASEDTVQVQLALNPDETEAGDLGALEYNTGSGWVSVPVDGMVTVPAGMTEFDVRIGTTADDVYEGPEDFSVTVTGVGAVQGSDTGLATIVDDGTITDDDRPSVSISDAGLVDEGTTATFTVTLSNASEDTVQVQLALNPDETEAGDLGTLEYNTGSGWVSVPVDGMVTVPAGMTEFDVRIGTTADDVYEGPEDFSVTVTGVGAVQGSDTGLATIVDDGTITDDDRPSVSISDAGLVDEGNTATFTVSLSNASEDTVQVQLALNPDETEAGDLGTLEYNTGAGWVAVPVDGMVTVPAGMTEFDVRVATIDDEVYEGPEDFSVTVTGVGVVQGSDTGLATIVDDGTITDDDRPSVSISDAGLVDEGNTATFTVSLSNASEDAVQVQLTLNPDETEAGDLGTLEYNTGAGWVAVPVDGMVTVPAGMTEFDVRVATIDDEVYEGPEDFSVTVTGVGAVQGSDTGLATIVDDGTLIDDDRPTVYIVEDSVGVNEGTDAVYTVRLSAVADIDVTVRLNTSTGGTNTAEPNDIGAIKVTLSDGVTVLTANSDGTYTIPAGETDLKLFVPTTDDDVYEGDETFTVAVQGATGALGNDTALGIIYDGGNGPGPDPDDDRPTVSISDAGIVDEGDTATFTVSLSNASEGTVQVQLALNPDETEVGDLGTLEYNTGSGWVAVPLNGIVTVPAMLTEFDVRIATIDDEVYEGPEDFSVTVTGLGAVQGSDTGLATIVDDGTITDDDRPTVSITDAGTIDEGNFATFTVSLSNASEAAVQVQLTLNLDETEVGDLGTLEYNTGSGWVSVPVSGIVTVPAGMTEFDLRIESIDDGVYEGPEDFSVTVTGLGPVQGSDTGLATIVDNSPPTARDFIISLTVQDGIFPVQDVDFDGLTSANEQRVEDLEDDANGANDADLEIVITSLPEHGELYYLDNGVEVIIDQDFLNDPNNKLYENTDIKYRLTEDFFDEQSFDSADLLEDQGKDILVGSYTPPNSNLTFTGGTIEVIGNSIIFDSDAQISVDFANQQVGLVVVSPSETGQGDEISTGEYITLELDEDLSANEAKLNLASLNDRFNSGAAWLTAYIFLNGALVDVQQFYSTDINYTSNHEGFITVAMANGSFDEIRLTPETNSASDKAGFTLVGTEITSFTDVNDDFTYQAIDTDGALSNEATVSVDFNNVTAESVATADYNTQSLTLTAAADAESNIILGDEQDNELVGTSGDDILIGGLGNDILTGGEGDDVFKWTEMKTATDTVTDFETGDKLDFADLFEDVSQSDISILLDDLGSGDYSGQVDDISITVTERGPNSTLMIHKGGMDLEVNFDGASAADIANSLISNLEHLRE